MTLGARRRPTTPDGYHYVCVTAGTTGATQPGWPGSEGAYVSDGSVVWACMASPLAGQTWYAEAEIFTAGLTAGKGGAVQLALNAYDTAMANTGASNPVYDYSGTAGKPARSLPGVLRLRTTPITIPANLRYLYATVGGFGEAGASFGMDVGRVSIRRAS